MTLKHQNLSKPAALIAALCVAAHVVLVASTAGSESPTGSPRESTPAGLTSMLRRPVAMVLNDRTERLLVANRQSGTISVIDAAKDNVIGESLIARSISDLKPVPGGRWMLATDEVEHELLLLEIEDSTVLPVSRVAVAATPVSLTVTADGSRCYVASLWPRRLSIVELDLPADGPGGHEPRARVTKSITLPFAPRLQCLLEDRRRLLIADSFAGQLAVIDLDAQELAGVCDISGHNIRGMARSPDGESLLVAHQRLNSRAPTVRNDVHWGVVMSNRLGRLPIDAVLDLKIDPLGDSFIGRLGTAGSAAGDPAAIAASPGGHVVVALAGVGEVAASGPDFGGLNRIRVGRRPTAVAIAADDRRAYVANTHDDSISIVDLESYEETERISLGPKPKLNTAQQGEVLFYDARLSHDGWYSCGSCHVDGHTNGLASDNESDGSFGTPKRVLSLLGVRDTGPWAWDGGVDELAAQVEKSIVTTMQGRDPNQRKVEALVAYLRTLEPAPAQWFGDEVDAVAIERGRKVFHARRCDRCHAPPTYTSAGIYDVGFEDEAGSRRFNPPSLRGVSHRRHLLHDNRAGSLREVFIEHGHQIAAGIEPQELDDLVAFLGSL